MTNIRSMRRGDMTIQYGPRIDSACLMCQRDFRPLIREIKRGKGKVCSKECSYKWQSYTKRIDFGGKARYNIKRKKDRTKDRAREAVHRAIRRGELIPDSCEICGTEPVEAHHEDYSKPLTIRWLCQKHHREADKKLGLRAI